MNMPPPYTNVRPSELSWAPLIPEHWEVRRAKYIFNLERRPVRAEDEVVTAFRDGEVTLRKNRRTAGFTNSEKEIGYQGVRKGDLVIHAMDAFAGAVGVSDLDGKCTPVYSCCTPVELISIGFYGRMLRTMALTGFIESLSKGIRERSTDFRWREFAEQSLPVPPLAEQQAISRYVDREVERIENLIAKKQTLVRLLKEKRDAIISRIVTKGINPSVATKSAKASWLNAIPRHWSEAPFSAVSEERKTKNVGMQENNLLSLSYGKIVRKDINTNDGLLPASFETYQIIERDDVIFRFTDLQNDKRSLRSAISTERGIITSAYLAVVLKGIVPQYFNYLMRAYDLHKVFYAMGGGLRQSLSYDDVKRMPILLPTRDEQIDIVDFLDRETLRIDSLVQKVTRSIELLREHRTALITAAVTGKIDVRNAA